MPKVADFLHRYRSPLGTPAICRVRLYQAASGLLVAIASELAGTAPSASITNVAEELATQIRSQVAPSGQGFVWIEHYPAWLSARGETFDRVLLKWDGAAYIEPEWRPTTRAAVEALIGEALEHEETTL
ncbi:MAG TPA: hypothetical protein VFS21_31060 [Roseiflexaceae bacterium]|nr:hypothetical protein [Roseiflexaceae bacterium]